ncbi:glycosyltransferase family 2 protein [Paracrocinitomix mangrovi]|uniref:glycosyltransferase family 2 protein n=1 Tax=Paracrocinitomix mangrovi TaxID=2862509 RepID=UPI001C8E3EC6|nr:glycosyltransferase family 2 protein [Paracrocinitomix mangrovi]UKN00670.1 glycosyltransferase family 2 protein [Paracrocinitomix mangrovi]
MDQLSVVIITLNEERNIGRAIDSVMKVADEIIVLDSFSTDKTAEICKDKGVRFVQEQWHGYAKTKNLANSLSTHEWILSLDADEALDETLQQAVLEAKERGFKGVYIMNRLTNYCGSWIKHSSWYPDFKIRIFPKSKTSWEGEFVHEELNFTENLVENKLKGHLLHYSYYTYTEHRSRADKYSILTAQKLHASGKKVGLMKPYISAFGRFVTMYILKLGILDGWKGFKIAQISAASNILKYKELIRLNKENGN